jgi:hypothetical protein
LQLAPLLQPAEPGRAALVAVANFAQAAVSLGMAAAVVRLLLVVLLLVAQAESAARSALAAPADSKM